MDTLGNLIDKQLTANLKLVFTNDAEKIENLAIQLKCLRKEIDNMSDNTLKGRISQEDSIRPQHKTY